MQIYSTFITSLVLFILIISKGYKLPLQVFNFILYVYLAILAPGFWLDVGSFVGYAFTSYDVTNCAQYLQLAFLISALTIYILPFRNYLCIINADSQTNSLPRYSNQFYFLVVSIITSSFFLVFLNQGVKGTLTKLLYQFTDFSVPLLALLLLAKHWKKFYFLMFLYSSFSIYTGFRYKLLFALIVVISYFISTNKRLLTGKLSLSNFISFKYVLVSPLIIAFVLFFSAMTTTRIKGDINIFGNLLSAFNSVIVDNFSLLFSYSFFAESNIFIGLLVILNSSHKLLVNFPYLFDSVFSHVFVLIPNFLRFNYDYLALNKYVLSMFGTDQALYSGTAFPYIGYLNLVFSPYLAIVIYLPIIFFALFYMNKAIYACLSRSGSFSLTSSHYLESRKYVDVRAYYTFVISFSMIFLYMLMFRGYSPEMFKFMIVLLLGLFLSLSTYRIKL